MLDCSASQLNLQLTVIAPAKRERPIVTIDGRAYEQEQLSDLARQQLIRKQRTLTSLEQVWPPGLPTAFSFTSHEAHRKKWQQAQIGPTPR